MTSPADLNDSAIRASAGALALLSGVVAAAALLLLASPRLTVPYFFVLALGWIGVRRHDLGRVMERLWHDRVALALFGFLVYALVACLWSVDPGRAAGKVAYLALIVTASLVVARLVMAQTAQGAAVAVARGLAIGLGIGAFCFAIDCITEQSLKIAIINTFGVPRAILQPDKFYHWSADGLLTRISDVLLTRAASPISVLMWPAAAGAVAAFAGQRGRVTAGLMIAIAFTAAMVSPQESSKTAALAGLIVFAIAWLAVRPARGLLAAGWVALCLAILPAALLAHRAELHKAPWVPASAQHRVVIWNFTAEKTLEAPILGLGPYTIYLAGQKLSSDAAAESDGSYTRNLSRHSHNVYLQTWVELGAVGAVLLALAGLGVLGGIGRLAPSQQPFALATFAAAMLLMASSYGMWQSWFLALFGLATILLAIALRTLAAEGRSPE